MVETYSQEIKQFAKMSLVICMARSFQKNQMEWFVIFFLIFVMDRKGQVILDDTITKVLHDITGWNQETMAKIIWRLDAEGLLSSQTSKRLQMNDIFTNKMRVVKNRNGYKGKDPDYGQSAREVVERVQKLLSRVTKNRPADDDEESKMIRELKAEIKNMREMDAEKAKLIEEKSRMIEFLQDTVKTQGRHIEMLLAKFDRIVAAAASDDLPSVKACLRLVHSVPATVE